MDHISQHLIIVFIVFVIYTSYTFAPWKERPVDPPAGTFKNCKNWVTMYGFSENDLIHNVTEALSRSREFDVNVSRYAAIYAQMLCSFHQNDNFYPSDFCSIINSSDEYETPFHKLEGDSDSCVGWLKSYGFIERDRTNTETDPNILNWRISQSRDKSEDKYISIWLSLFFRYLDEVPEEKSITEYQFCAAMGQGEYKVYWTFVNLDTKMTCEKWLQFAGYFNTKNFDENMEKFNEMKTFNKYINTWAQRYGVHLNSHDESSWLKPYSFCKGNDEELFTYFHYDVKL